TARRTATVRAAPPGPPPRTGRGRAPRAAPVRTPARTPARTGPRMPSGRLPPRAPEARPPPTATPLSRAPPGHPAARGVRSERASGWELRITGPKTRVGRREILRPVRPDGIGPGRSRGNPTNPLPSPLRIPLRQRQVGTEDGRHDTNLEHRRGTQGTRDPDLWRTGRRRARRRRGDHPATAAGRRLKSPREIGRAHV